MFHQIAFVGFGLIGGSMALALRAAWPACRIHAIDCADVAARALQLGAADAAADDLALAQAADLVVLSAPVRQKIKVLRELATTVTGEAIVTDVGSTKRAMVDA